MLSEKCRKGHSQLKEQHECKHCIKKGYRVFRDGTNSERLEHSEMGGIGDEVGSGCRQIMKDRVCRDTVLDLTL